MVSTCRKQRSPEGNACLGLPQIVKAMCLDLGWAGWPWLSGKEMGDFNHRPCVLPTVKAQSVVDFPQPLWSRLFKDCLHVCDLSTSPLLHFFKLLVSEVGCN